MGTMNRQVIKPQSGTAVKDNRGTINCADQYIDVPLDFSGNVAGNGMNVPYYRIDFNQLSDSFGYAQGLKVDTRNMNTDLCIAVRGGALGELTNVLPGDGVEFRTVVPGVIMTLPIESTQDMFFDVFVTNSDPVASAATYGSAVIYVTNFALDHAMYPSEASRGLIAPAGKALNIAATGTQNIIVWTGPLPSARILHGARLVKPVAVTSALLGGIKVVINAVVTTPTTGAQNIPLITLYNYSPTAAAPPQIDTYGLGSGEGIYLPKFTTALQAIATFDQALTAGALELEILLEDSSNDIAPLT